MLIIKDINNLKNYINQYKSENRSIGMIPTMGALHDGHGALIKSSKEHNDKTIVSIFINPKQFNNKDDLSSYPTNKGSDYDYAIKNNVDIVFEPDQKEIYPEDFQSIKNSFYKNILCDLHRPGHFDGVITVVNELLNLASPNKVYFGLKDYQQFKIIEKLIDKSFSDIQIYGVETVRDQDGLALSSRNKLINKPNREIYINFINTMNKFISNFDPETEIQDANQKLNSFIKETIDQIKKFEYCEFRSVEDMSMNGKVKNSRLFMAFYILNTRLIDNLKA
jgi:pantoate--beta-alanine ligase